MLNCQNSRNFWRLWFPKLFVLLPDTFSHQPFSTPQSTPYCPEQRKKPELQKGARPILLVQGMLSVPSSQDISFLLQIKVTLVASVKLVLRSCSFRIEKTGGLLSSLLTYSSHFTYLLTFSLSKKGLPMYHPLTVPAAPFYLKKLYLLCQTNLVIPNLCIEHDILVFHDSAFLG